MICHADEPKRNLYPYYVAREMSKHVTVALGGLGADELFGGYVYRFNRLRELNDLGTLPDRTRETLTRAATQISDFQLESGNIENDDILEDIDSLRHLGDSARLYVLLNSSDVIGDPRLLRERAFGNELDAAVDPGDWIQSRSPIVESDLREQALRWDYDVKMPDDFLLVEDRMSMAHSLESRVPFLDNGLIDLAFSLPLSEKFETSEESVGKAVLRKAMQGKLPDSVFKKDKQGFTMPTYPFVRDELLEHAHVILDEPYIVQDGLIDDIYIDTLLNRNPSKELVHHYKLLWRLVALEIWYQMYIIEDVEGPKQIEQYY
jgi:asparagine synthase (glutamine-hydrolysing)